MTKTKAKTKSTQSAPVSAKPQSTISTEAWTFTMLNKREFNLVKITIEDGIVTNEEILKTDLPMIVLGKLKHTLMEKLLKLKDS